MQLWPEYGYPGPASVSKGLVLQRLQGPDRPKAEHRLGFWASGLSSGGPYNQGSFNGVSGSYKAGLELILVRISWLFLQIGGPFRGRDSN